MMQYFSQFGTVNRLRLSRNKKTGRSKHYAFIEFMSEEVAKIVAETMDNYLLYNHLLKCKRSCTVSSPAALVCSLILMTIRVCITGKIVPESKVHESLWKGANIKFKPIPWAKITSEQ